MQQSDDDLRAELLKTNVEYRALHDEHQECEERLDNIHQQSMLSEQDEIREKQIKLHKLALKDRMGSIVRNHRQTAVSA